MSSNIKDFKSSKRKKVGKYLSSDAIKEEMQIEFLKTASELEPKILDEFPLSSCLRLIANDNGIGWYYHRIPKVILDKDILPDVELINFFPNSSKNTFHQDYLQFNEEILAWVDKFFLRKEWILLSILSGVEQFLTYVKWDPNKKLTFTNIVKMKYGMGVINTKSEDAIHGINIDDYWHSSTESFNDYESRVINKLADQREKVFEKLAGYKEITKPRNLDKLKWLIRWNIHGKKAHEICDEFKITERTFWSFLKTARVEWDLPVLKRNK